MAKRNRKTPEQEAYETWVQAEMDKIDNPVDLIKFYKSEYKNSTFAPKKSCSNGIKTE